MTLLQSAQATFSALTSWLRSVTSRWWGAGRNGYKPSFPTQGGTLPSCSVAPTLSPAGPVASGTVLTMGNGTWVNASSFAYQWTENGVPVGMNSNTYTSTTPGAVVGGSVIANGTLSQAASNAVTVQQTLVNLALSASSVNEDSANGTVIGQILNLRPGEVPSMHAGSDARLTVNQSGGLWYLVTTGATIDYETATSLSYGLDGTLAGASNTPHATLGLSVAVVNQNDTNPSAFNFSPVSGAALNSTQMASMMVAGLGASDSVTASISGDPTRIMRKNGGAWVAGPISGVVNGNVIDVELSASGSNSTTSTVTLTVGTTAATFSVTTVSSTGGVSLDAPVLTVFNSSSSTYVSTPTSVTGTPLFHMTIPSVSEGEADWVEEQIDTANTFNSGAGGAPLFSETRVLQWTGSAYQLASLDPTNPYVPGNFLLDSSLSSSTTYYIRRRFRRNYGDSILDGPFSNVIQITTVAVSSAILTTNPGLRKSALLTLSGGPPALTVSGTSGNGGNYVASTIEQAYAKAPLELILVSGASGGSIRFGLYNDADNLNSNINPGQADANAVIIESSFGVGINLIHSAGGTNFALASGANSTIDSDKLDAVFDVVNHNVSLYRVRSGTPLQMGTTQSIPTLSHNFAIVGSANATFTATINFGAASTPFGRTPGTGEGPFWA